MKIETSLDCIYSSCSKTAKSEHVKLLNGLEYTVEHVLSCMHCTKHILSSQ